MERGYNIYDYNISNDICGNVLISASNENGENIFNNVLNIPCTHRQ